MDPASGFDGSKCFKLKKIKGLTRQKKISRKTVDHGKLLTEV